MAASKNPDPSATDAVDWIFTYFSPQPSWDRQAIAPAKTPAPLLQSAREAPPAIKDVADLRSANEWLQREWERLQQYTEMQLARIQNESQALVNQNHLNEQTMILGCQELSRKEELLARQSRALQQQAAELSQREQALRSQMEQWSRVRSEVGDLSQVRVQTEQETAQHRALLETLRGETLALQKARETTHAELEAMARALDEQRKVRVREQELTLALQAEMEQRRRALDKAEQAVQRRFAELDELEARLRQEFEEQDRQLAERRREAAALVARLRQEGVAHQG